MGSRAERRRREKSGAKAAAKGEAAPEARRRRNRIIAIASIVALVGTIGFLVLNADDEECPGHWHATFAVAIDGERVRFPQPPYNMDREGGKMPMSLHMHRGNEELLHFEPAAPRCVGVEAAMRSVDVILEAGELRLEGAHAAGQWGGTYRDEGNRTLRLFIEAPDGELREERLRDIAEYQLRDGEKLLIAFGDYQQADIEEMMNEMGTPSG